MEKRNKKYYLINITIELNQIMIKNIYLLLNINEFIKIFTRLVCVSVLEMFSDYN